MEIKTKNKEKITKWTWYLYLFINVIQIIGIGISWSLLQTAINNGTTISQIWYISIILCNLIAAIGGCLFYYIETKELFYIKLHIPNKCFKFYIASGFLFLLCLIFTSVFTSCIQFISPNYTNILIPFSILIGVCALISITAVGLYRYGKFIAERAMYKRKHGEIQNQKNEIKKERETIKTKTADEIWTMRDKGPDDSGINTPTTNLIKHVDQEQKN